MKFFTFFLFGTICSFFIWILLVIGEFNNPTLSSQWIYDVYKEKQFIAREIKSKKIIILAGSNALFGVDSNMISKAFNFPVLNYGVNAGIELPLTLELAKKVINKGDIIIAPLEYPMYSYKGTAGVQMIDYLLSREPKFFWNLTFYEQFYILWHVSIERVYKGYFYKGGKTITKGLYGSHHIDKITGDQILTESKYRTDWMWNEVINNYAIHPEKYGHSFNNKAFGWDYLEEFMAWCKSRNVKIIFMPSTLMKNSFYFDDVKEKWFYENISSIIRQKGWIYVGNPYSYMYEAKNYFDTNFHLIASKRHERTQQMIEDLKPYFKKMR